MVVSALSGSSVAPCTVIAFPLGATGAEGKVRKLWRL